MMTIRVVWRSSLACVVAKPAGLATQSVGDVPSLEWALTQQWKDPSAADTPKRPGSYLAFPHRLDRPVGGVILVALSKRAAGLLGQQFETRKICKAYLAWVEGNLEPASDGADWVWTDRLRKVLGEPRAEIVGDQPLDLHSVPGHSAEEAGKVAITRVRVLRQESGRTLVRLHPETGRMHQLRIQCAHRGHPIVGDYRYGASLNPDWDAESRQIVLSGDAIALYAHRIGFHAPEGGRWTEVRDLPPWETLKVTEADLLG
jgi:23S rRNA-/tRNA-specific pseudouridylate synthase